MYVLVKQLSLGVYPIASVLSTANGWFASLHFWQFLMLV